jgi:hypothetical protein
VKKPPSDDDNAPIVLDSEHAAVQSENHSKSLTRLEQEFELLQKETRDARQEGEQTLVRAFSNQYDKSVLEVFLTRVAIALSVWMVYWTYSSLHSSAWINLFFMSNIFGLNIRPFPIFALADTILIVTVLRLRLKGIYLEMIHGMSLANPDNRLLTKIETKIHVFNRINRLYAWLICTCTFALGFSSFGWEYAVTSVAGAKGTIIFFIVVGTVSWLLTKPLFELRTDL